MKKLIQVFLPTSLVGWVFFIFIACVYVVLEIQVLLASEVFYSNGTRHQLTIFEQIIVFPAFYFNYAPLTELIINAAFWGLSVTKFFCFCLRKIVTR